MGSDSIELMVPEPEAATHPNPPATEAGVVVGLLMGFDAAGAPLVVYPGNQSEEAVPARTAARLSPADVGCEVALLFEDGDLTRPLAIGRILHPERDPRPAPRAEPVHAQIDGERVELTAAREIVLRCGKASITLTHAGKILLRGAYIFSRSTGVNKIKGGSVQLN